MKPHFLIICCAAIARELHEIKKLTHWAEIELQSITADLHLTPNKIAPAVASKIDLAGDDYDQIFVAYGDCGTSGALDLLIESRGVSRLPGAHCYEFLAGGSLYAELQDQDPGTFYLTDFLAQHFDRLVIGALGLDKHPELLSLYFGNYSRLIYLAQTESEKFRTLAAAAASRLGLTFEYIFTGTGAIQPSLDSTMQEAIWQR